MPAPTNPCLKGRGEKIERVPMFRFELEARVVTTTHTDWQSYGVHEYDERWPSLSGTQRTDSEGNTGRFRNRAVDPGPLVPYSIVATDAFAMRAKLETVMGFTDVDATENRHGCPVMRVQKELRYSVLSVEEF